MKIEDLISSGSGQKKKGRNILTGLIIALIVARMITGSMGGAIVLLVLLAGFGWWFWSYVRGKLPSLSPKTNSTEQVTTKIKDTTNNNSSFSFTKFATNFHPMRIASIIIIAIVTILVLSRIFVVVPAGSIGIYALFGKVSQHSIQPGLNFINPLGSVIKMSTRTEAYTMSIAKEEGQKVGDDSIDALTKEGLSVKLDMTALYHLDSTKAAELYKTVGRDYTDKIIRPAIRSSIRQIVAEYDAAAVYSEKRAELTDKITSMLTASLGPRGVILEEVLLRNVILPQKLADSISEKLQAEQESQRYEFVLQKEKKEADRKRIEAEGLRDSQKTIAEGLTPAYLNFLYLQNLKDNKGTIYVPTGTTNGLPLFKNVGQ